MSLHQETVGSPFAGNAELWQVFVDRLIGKVGEFVVISDDRGEEKDLRGPETIVLQRKLFPCFEGRPGELSSFADSPLQNENVGEAALGSSDVLAQAQLGKESLSSLEMRYRFFELAKPKGDDSEIIS